MSDDEEDYEFEYSDAEDEAMGGEVNEDDPAVKIENLYYNSKGQLGSDNAGAEAGFREVLGLADGQGSGSALEEWGFKATKQLVKLACRTGRFGDMLTHYRSLLKRIAAGAATRNRSEKAINSILDLVSSSAEPTSAERSGPTASSSSSLSGAVSDGRGDGGSATTGGGSLLQDFYGTTLAALEGAAGNDRLCFKTRLKLARLHLAQRDWRALGSLLSALQESVAGPVAGSAGGSEGDDRSRATQALEVYALMIQMYTELRDMKRLAATYKRAVAAARTAVPHPAITGVIHECGGKIHMRDRDWDAARVEFVSAFKAYEEAGNGSRTIACLKYLLLANILSTSNINPFDSQDTKAYEKDPAISAMTELTSAYLAGDIAAFEPILRRAKPVGAGAGATSSSSSSSAPTGGGGDDLASDEFMRSYLDDLMTTIRTQVLLSRVTPYARVRLDWLAAELNVTPAEAEALAVTVILDGRLPGASLDQVAGVLTLRAVRSGDASGAGTPAPQPFGHAALAQAAAAAAAAAASGTSAATSGSALQLFIPLSSNSRDAAFFSDVESLASRLGSLASTLAAPGLNAGASAGASSSSAAGGMHMGGGGAFAPISVR